jgi:hypothetical protein
MSVSIYRSLISATISIPRNSKYENGSTVHTSISSNNNVVVIFFLFSSSDLIRVCSLLSSLLSLSFSSSSPFSSSSSPSVLTLMGTKKNQFPLANKTRAIHRVAFAVENLVNQLTKKIFDKMIADE